MNNKKDAENTLLEKFEKSIEEWSGRSIDEIRKEPLADLFFRVKKQKGHLRLISHFPFIGRGIIQRENIISHEDIEKELDKILN